MAMDKVTKQSAAGVPGAVQGFLDLHALCHGFLAGCENDLVHGLDHGLVDRAVRHAFKEGAVDFQLVHRQVLQVGE